MNDKLDELERKIRMLDKRVSVIEMNVSKLAELMADHSHFMHLIARQLRQISSEMDVNIDPPRYQ